MGGGAPVSEHLRRGGEVEGSLVGHLRGCGAESWMGGEVGAAASRRWSAAVSEVGECPTSLICASNI
jgi:hypothetical protein